MSVYRSCDANLLGNLPEAVLDQVEPRQARRVTCYRGRGAIHALAWRGADCLWGKGVQCSCCGESGPAADEWGVEILLDQYINKRKMAQKKKKKKKNSKSLLSQQLHCEKRIMY